MTIATPTSGTSQTEASARRARRPRARRRPRPQGDGVQVQVLALHLATPTAQQERDMHPRRVARRLPGDPKSGTASAGPRTTGGKGARRARAARLMILRRRLHTLVMGLLAMFVLSMGVTGGGMTANASNINEPTPQQPASREVAQGCNPLAPLTCVDDAVDVVVPGDQSGGIPGLPGLPSVGGIAGDAVGEIFDRVQGLMCFGTIDEGPRAAPPRAIDALYGEPSQYTLPFINQQFGNKSVTFYEMYGMDGLVWSEYRPQEGWLTFAGPGCVIDNLGPFIGNQIANQVFGWSQTVTRFTIGVYEASANPDLLDGFNRPLKCIIEGCNGGKGLKKALFLEYLTPVIMFGALWGAWIGLFRKQSVQAAQGGLWMVVACGFSLAFLGAPDRVVDETNEVVGDISSQVMNGVTSASSSVVPRKDICFIDRGSGNNNRGTRMSACSMYKAMALAPWSAGQFGEPLGVPLPMDTPLKVGNKVFRDARFVQIDSQAISHDDWLEMGGSPVGYVRYFDATEAKQDRWDLVREWIEDGGADMRMWSGEAYGERINIGFAALLGSFLIGILVILISFSTIVLAVGTVLLVMMSPLFLLIGIHPGFGRGIALKWLELLIGTAFKRIVLSAMLAILVGMYQVILETPMPWFTQMLLVAAIGVGALIYRKPMLETLNVINLGGTRTGMEQGGQGAQRMAKKAVATGSGGGAGAVAAFAAGGTAGAVLSGAFRGGTMGSRSGSPLRAATMGSATGKRAARASQRSSGDTRPQQQDPYADAPSVDTMDTDLWPINAKVVRGPDGELYWNDNYDPATNGQPRRAPKKPRPKTSTGGGKRSGGAGPRPGSTGGGGDGGSGPDDDGPGPSGGGGSGPRPGGSGPRPGGSGGSAGSGGSGGTAGAGAPAGPATGVPVPVVPVTPSGTPILTSPSVPRPPNAPGTPSPTPSGNPPVPAGIPGTVLPGAGVVTGAAMGSVAAPASGANGGSPRAGTPAPAPAAPAPAAPAPTGPAATPSGTGATSVAPAAPQAGGSPRPVTTQGAVAPSAPGTTPGSAAGAVAGAVTKAGTAAGVAAASGSVGLPIPVVAMPSVPRPPQAAPPSEPGAEATT